MKLSDEDKNELIKRTELINSHTLISQALELQKQFWIQDKFKKYELDLNKKYNFNLITGEITEV